MFWHLKPLHYHIFLSLAISPIIGRKCENKSHLSCCNMQHLRCHPEVCVHLKRKQGQTHRANDREQTPTQRLCLDVCQQELQGSESTLSTCREICVTSPHLHTCETHTHTHTMGDGVCSDTGGCQFKPHALTALPPHSIATPLCHTLTIPLPFTD